MYYQSWKYYLYGQLYLTMHLLDIKTSKNNFWSSIAQSFGTCSEIDPVFEIRPFRLSETSKICKGQSIVTKRLSARTINFSEGYFYITLLFKVTVTVRVGNFDYSGELNLVG